MKKKITRKKNPSNKKHFFFAKILEYIGIYGLFYMLQIDTVDHMLHCTQQRERVRDRGENYGSYHS